MGNSESYFLKLIAGDNPGTKYELHEGENSIGRHVSNDICLSINALVVSSKHAIVIISPAGISIEDCESTNGTFVNQIRISQKALEPGDEIGLGQNGPRFILGPATNEDTADSDIPAIDPLKKTVASQPSELFSQKQPHSQTPQSASPGTR